MEGLMMNFPLTLQPILRRARDIYPQNEIITRLADGGVHRYTYGEFYQRVLRLMDALKRAGVKPGDRVATFAWNRYQHMELYYAIPCLGAVLHTLNIRLSTEQMVYTINHAEDRFIFVDDVLTDQLLAVQDECPQVERFVVIAEQGSADDCGLRGQEDYEAFLAGGEPVEDFPEIDENAACAMCYTSGTTGNPKGALYSHRSLYLHSMCVTMADTMALSQYDIVLPIVPMFHVNCWGIPFAAVMTGATIIYPGQNPQAADLVSLIQNEKVTLAAGVPTIWNMVAQYVDQNGGDLSSLQRVVCGGSAVPRALMEKYEDDYGVPIIQLWGMTELSPLGTVSHIKRHMREWPRERQYEYRLKQGIPVPGIEVRIEDEQGNLQPWDGEHMGELVVRGAWVIRDYYRKEGGASAFKADGWFGTGDVARMDGEGYMQITDRVKDLIKSGGEWISSVDMENLLVAHSDVLEAAVVARPDAKWDERPVAFVVPVEGRTEALTPDSVREWLSAEFAQWQLPYADDVHTIDAIPKTSVGKIDKKVLRRRFD